MRSIISCPTQEAPALHVRTLEQQQHHQVHQNRGSADFCGLGIVDRRCSDGRVATFLVYPGVLAPTSIDEAKGKDGSRR